MSLGSSGFYKKKSLLDLLTLTLSVAGMRLDRLTGMKHCRFWGWDLPGLGGGVSGPKPQKSEKSLEKVLGPSGPKSLKKVSGRVRKVSKKSKNGFFETFRTLPRLFSDFWGPRVRGLFRDFFQTFGVSARRLLLPGRGDPNFGGLKCRFPREKKRQKKRDEKRENIFAMTPLLSNAA